MKKEDAKAMYKKIGGREGIAKRCLKIAREIVEMNSYKRATAGAGQLRVLAEIAEKGDSYWGEIQERGRRVEHDFLLHGCRKPFLRHDGHLDVERTNNPAPEE